MKILKYIKSTLLKCFKCIPTKRNSIQKYSKYTEPQERIAYRWTNFCFFEDIFSWIFWALTGLVKSEVQSFNDLYKEQHGDEDGEHTIFAPFSPKAQFLVKFFYKNITKAS